jgi:HEAT repeat protein
MTLPGSKAAVPFQTILDALLDSETPFPPYYYHRFSDLPEEELAEVKKVWAKVTPERRASLMSALVELYEADTLVCFDEIGEFALDDSNPGVRMTALKLFWENPPNRLARRIIRMLKLDADENVRAAAASLLGQYVYAGELGEIPETTAQDVEDALLDVYDRKIAPVIRRRALEAIAYSSRDEVEGLVEQAYRSHERDWIITALLAMGRSANERWEKTVLEHLEDDDPEFLFEAVRAAGSLNIAGARQRLIEILEDPDLDDADIRRETVWSLSQIGGKEARSVLSKLTEQAEDDEEVDFLSEALDNLDFNSEAGLFGMLDLGMLDNDDLDTIIDVTQEALDEEDAPQTKPKRTRRTGKNTQ